MPSETTEDTTDAPVDEARSALLEAITADLGDAVVGHHLVAGSDLWVRVGTEAWGDLAAYLRERQRFRFFSWLSAIDWMPSPFGRSLDANVDNLLEPTEANEPAVGGSGHAGGDTRFQVLARVHNLSTGLGITVKADVPDDSLSVGTWTASYPGAEWHEREAWEMFGIDFAGHPGLRHIYLPGEFEGHPMRKDYPLLARLIKPWPGIVDVEPMPGSDDEPSTDNPEGTT
ncbi:MAG: NADH-quinone oxidoreductase subunit C [Acidimicrobiales bacterium]